MVERVEDELKVLMGILLLISCECLVPCKFG